MFPDSLYRPIFEIFIIVLVIIKSAPVEDSCILSYDRNSYVKTYIIGFLLIIFFGLRNPDGSIKYFADTSGYAAFYNMVGRGDLMSTTDELNYGVQSYTGEWLFYVIRDFFAVRNFEVNFWFIIVAAIYIIPVILGIHKLLPGYEYLMFLFWICSFGFYSGGVNGIRNANAISIFFLGFICISLYRNKNIKTLILGCLLCLISYLFHHSVIILIISFIASLFWVKNTKFALLIWTFAIITSLFLGNTMAIIAVGLGFEERASSYLGNGSNTNAMTQVFAYIGFRWDFLLFSSMPIIFGYYVTIYKRIKDRFYQILLNTYILANSVWIIFMYAEYTNRFAALSWFLFPFVLCYPMIKFEIFPNNRNLITCLMLLGMVVFGLLF